MFLQLPARRGLGTRKRKPAAAGIRPKKSRDIDATKNAPPKAVRDFLREHLTAISRAGGKARQARLTKQQRSELARRAALKRWHKPEVVEITPGR
jgi:hypothetical protein